MKRISKRSTSILVIICMLAGLLPVFSLTASAGFTNSTTIISSTSGGATLINGYVYTVSGSPTITGSAGGNGLNVAANSTAVINIPSGSTLTVNGGVASGGSGGSKGSNGGNGSMYKSSTATVSARSADGTANTNSNIEYTVTLDKQGGSGGSSSATATLGVSMPSISVPTHTGYTFNGYYSSTSGGTQYYNGSGASVNPWTTANNHTLYAQWTINQYTVTFNSNGGTAVSDDTQNYGTTIASPETTKAGYTFAGWCTDSGLETAASFPYTVSANATLYAKWTADIKTISFNANGGTGAQMTAMTGATDSFVTLTANTYAKMGHAFACWSTAADGNGTNYTNAQENVTMPAGGLTLYAKWTVHTHNVVYDGNGHNGGSEPTTVACDYNATVTVSERGTMVRAGYTFLGWSETQVSDTAEYPAGMTFSMPDSVVTLYAVWEINTYNVGYDGNGYTGGTLPTGGTLAYNTAVDVTIPVPLVRTGYTFLGWSEAQSATTATYAAPGHFTVLDHNMTLYAVWEVNQYTVTYHKNGITTAVIPADVPAHDYGTITKVGAAAAAEGYTFMEWNTKANEMGTSYAPGTEFALPEGNVTLYAIWDTNTYQISYDGNGNTGETAPGNQSVAYSAVATLQGQGLLARKGYDFLGWSTQQNATVKEYDGGGTMGMGAADVTLYAVWSPHKYTLEYNANSATGGDLPTGPELTTYGTTIIVKDNQVTTPLTKTGYSFVGWNTSVDGLGFDYVKDSTS